LKITFFINRPPPFVGGLQNVCFRVAKYFQESAGARVRIIGFPDQKNSHSSAEDLAWEHEGVEVRELQRGRREDLLFRWVPFLKKRRATFPLAIACYEWAYSRQISRLCQGSSVFHFFGTGMEMNGYAIADAAMKIQAKLVIEPAIHEGTWGDSWLDVPLYRMADLMIAHTGYEARLLENLRVPKEKIQTIVHGVDFCDSGDGARFREKHRISGPMVLFLGRKTKEKGVELLLNAWPMVAEKFPASTLVFAGPKNDEFDELKNNLTTDDTDGHGRGGAGPCLDKPIGAAFSNPFTSTLARDYENTSLNRSATCLNSALHADDRAIGSGGGNQLADSAEVWEGQSQAGLQMGFQKLQNIREANGLASSGKNSSSVLISNISGRKNCGTLDSGRSALAATQVLNLDDLAEEEKQDALAACDVLCVPSEGESFGMVYYEAWAYKKPVVALDLPVLRETIGQHGGGLLCKPEPSDIAESLIRLLGNSELQNKMGSSGYAAVGKHDWPRALESYSISYQILRS
jgi:glycosyltransferase involved in cell wall biosynthesis